jgi:hypothetical protein
MMHPAAGPESPATPPDPESYSDEIRQEIAITLGQTPPGEWAQLGLCPGRFGCPYATVEEAIAAGVEEHFCIGCRVIHLYRPA